MTSLPYDDDAARLSVPPHDDARSDVNACESKPEDNPTRPVGLVDTPVRDEARTGVSNLDEKPSTELVFAEVPNSETARPSSQGRDSYSLSVEQIMQRLDVEGVSKSRRTVQKYLNQGEIDGKLVSMANGKKWLANELDLARFIEELKRKEALALHTQPNRDALAGHLPGAGHLTPTQIAHETSSAVLEERVEQLQERLSSSQSEISYLRDQVQAANEHVKLWSDRASELKDLLEAQTNNMQPVLGAFATSLEAQARKTDSTDTRGRAPARIDQQ